MALESIFGSRNRLNEALDLGDDDSEDESPVPIPSRMSTRSSTRTRLEAKRSVKRKEEKNPDRGKKTKAISERGSKGGGSGGSSEELEKNSVSKPKSSTILRLVIKKPRTQPFVERKHASVVHEENSTKDSSSRTEGDSAEGQWQLTTNIACGISTRRRSRRETDAVEIQRTPRESIEAFLQAISHPKTPLFSSLFPKLSTRKSVLPLSALEGCEHFRKLSLMRYAACLCHAHSASLKTFVDAYNATSVGEEVRVDANTSAADNSTDETSTLRYSPPSLPLWKQTLSKIATKMDVSRTLPPLLESLTDVCSLVAFLVPTDLNDSDIDARRLLTNELYSNRSFMVALLEFTTNLSHAVHSILSRPDSACSVMIADCFESLVKTLRRVFFYELNLSAIALPTEPPDSIREVISRQQCSHLALHLFSCSRHSGARSGLSADGFNTDTMEEDDVNGKNTASPGFVHDVLQSLGRETGLRMIVKYCFAYLNRKGQKIRNTFVEFLLTLITVSRSRASVVLNEFSELRNSFREEVDQCVAQMVDEPVFWHTVLPSILKKLQKLPKVLTSVGILVQYDCFILNLIKSDYTSAREALFAELIVGLFSQFVRDPIGLLRKHKPKAGSVILDLTVMDVLAPLLRHSTVQREVVGNRDHAVKDAFLSSLDVLLTKIQTILPQVLSAEDAEKFAKKNILGGSDPIQPDGKGTEADKREAENGGEAEDDSEDSEDERESDEVSRLRVLTFTALLFAFCGKSFEDGSWNPEHACTLQIVLRSVKWRAKRQLGAFYQRLVNLQRALEKHIVLGSRTLPLMTVEDSNRFMFVLETIRCRFLESSTDRALVANGLSVGTSLRDTKDSLVGGLLSSRGNHASSAQATLLSAKLPSKPLGDELRNAVSGWDAKCSFDGTRDVMEFLNFELEATSRELVSRYDPVCTTPAKWFKTPNKRNYYRSAEARDLLKEKLLPSFCGCMFGRVPSSADIGANSKIACANDTCQNRSLKIECSGKSCPAGESCQNQRMQRMQYAKVERICTGSKGFGVAASEDIKPGGLIGEYQGEVIDEDEFNKRKQDYRGERHFYFMNLAPKLYIDASRIAQITRYINHSCDPNAETQKWYAAGEPRIGIFAKRIIRRGEEITFDYGTRDVGALDEAVKCLCGAANCRGYLVKPQNQDKAVDTMDSRESCSALTVLDKCVSEQARRDEMLKLAHAMQAHCKELSSLLLSTAAEVGDDAESATSSLANEKAKGRVLQWEQGIFQGKGRSTSGIGPLASSASSLTDLRHFRIPKKAPSPAVKDNSDTQERSSFQRISPRPGVSTQIPKKGVDSISGKPPTRKRLPPPNETKPAPKVRRTGAFAFAAYKKPKDRKAGGKLAPVVRNRKVVRKESERESDSDSCGDLSVASPTVPVNDDDIFVPEFDLEGEACSDDEFVEAPPVRDSFHTARGIRNAGSPRTPEYRERDAGRIDCCPNDFYRPPQDDPYSQQVNRSVQYGLSHIGGRHYERYISVDPRVSDVAKQLPDARGETKYYSGDVRSSFSRPTVVLQVPDHAEESVGADPRGSLISRDILDPRERPRGGSEAQSGVRAPSSFADDSGFPHVGNPHETAAQLRSVDPRVSVNGGVSVDARGSVDRRRAYRSLEAIGPRFVVDPRVQPKTEDLMEQSGFHRSDEVLSHDNEVGCTETERMNAQSNSHVSQRSSRSDGRYADKDFSSDYANDKHPTGKNPVAVSRSSSYQVRDEKIVQRESVCHRPTARSEAHAKQASHAMAMMRCRNGPPYPPPQKPVASRMLGISASIRSGHLSSAVDFDRSVVSRKGVVCSAATSDERDGLEKSPLRNQSKSQESKFEESRKGRLNGMTSVPETGRSSLAKSAHIDGNAAEARGNIDANSTNMRVDDVGASTTHKGENGGVFEKTTDLRNLIQSRGTNREVKDCGNQRVAYRDTRDRSADHGDRRHARGESSRRSSGFRR